jgi:hypothetical protein
MHVLGFEVVGVRRFVVQAHGAKNDEQIAVVGFNLGAAAGIHHVLDRERMKPEHLFQEGELLTDRGVDVHPERSAPILHAARQLFQRQVARYHAALFLIERAGQLDVVAGSLDGQGH